MKNHTVAALIGLWPSAETFARDLGLKHLSHGRVMKKRGSIPRKRWPMMIAAARRRRLPITRKLLEAAHTRG